MNVDMFTAGLVHRYSPCLRSKLQDYCDGSSLQSVDWLPLEYLNILPFMQLYSD